MQEHELNRQQPLESTQLSADANATTFTGQSELVAEQLEIVRARIRVATSPSEAPAPKMGNPGVRPGSPGGATQI